MKQNVISGNCGDVAFVIDASGSICDDDSTFYENNGQSTCQTWELVKEFMRRITDVLPIDYDRTKVGIVQFGNEAEVIWYLNE